MLLYLYSVARDVDWTGSHDWVGGCLDRGMFNQVGCLSDWVIATFCGRNFLLSILFSPFSQRYRLRLAPSPHWNQWTLIHLYGTWEPWKQKWVARRRVMSIILRKYPHICEWGCFHFVDSRLASCFSIALDSTPIRSSNDYTKGDKWSWCWSQD